MERVTVKIGAQLLVASPIPPGSFLVRVHPREGAPYDRMIVVSPSDRGDAIHLRGWIGKPLTPAQWLAAKHALFPKALTVRFERLQSDGTLSERVIPTGSERSA